MRKRILQILQTTFKIPTIRAFAQKSFHLDKYCFDSGTEKKFFLDLLKLEGVTKLYFTGMLTHSGSDFIIRYIDPISHTVCKYFPDFSKDDFVTKKDLEVFKKELLNKLATKESVEVLTNQELKNTNDNAALQTEMRMRINHVDDRLHYLETKFDILMSALKILD